MTGDLLRATAVTRGRTDTGTAQKVDAGEENVPTTPARAQTRDLAITIPAFYH